MLNDLTIPVKGTGNIRSALLATDTQFCFICREVVFLSSFLVVTVRMGYCASSATIQREQVYNIIVTEQEWAAFFNDAAEQVCGNIRMGYCVFSAITPVCGYNRMRYCVFSVITEQVCGYIYKNRLFSAVFSMLQQNKLVVIYFPLYQFVDIHKIKNRLFSHSAVFSML